MSSKKMKELEEAAKKVGNTTKVTSEMVARSLSADEPQKENSKDKMGEKRIYIGPNILGLITYTVIEGKYPGHIEKFVEDCPEIHRLFVPINELANSEKKKAKKGTIEHRNYRKVKEFFEEGDK